MIVNSPGADSVEWTVYRPLTGENWLILSSVNYQIFAGFEYGWYHVKARTYNSCGWSPFSATYQYQIIDCDTGDPGGRMASLAPNPAQNQVTVTVRSEIPIAQGGLDIRIKDMYGLEKIAVQSQTRETSLDISTLSVGIYIVYVQNGSKIEYLRLNVE